MTKKQRSYIKHGSTVFLRIAVGLIGLVVTAVCIFVVLPVAWMTNTLVYYPILAGLFASVVPFLLGLYEALKLLSYIDGNKAFSELSVNALARIKYYAVTISAIYVLGLPYIYVRAEVDDAPGVLVIGMVITFAAVVVATFAALLQKLLQNAVDIKSENDLTA